DDFVPAVRFRTGQPLAARRTDVPKTASERVAAGGDGLGEVAVDDDRIGLRGNVALVESATGEARHLIEIEERGIDLVEPGEESRRSTSVGPSRPAMSTTTQASSPGGRKAAATPRMPGSASSRCANSRWRLPK